MGIFSGKTILILGGGLLQLPAIQAAKALGLRVVVADANKEAAGSKKADLFWAIDLKDKEALAEAAWNLKIEAGGLDAVFTAGTDFSTTVAWIAEKCGLPGIPYQVALTCTDKVLMRKKLLEKGCHQPAFLEITENSELDHILDKLPMPLVVKPADNMGARGVRKITKHEELIPALKAALNFSRSKRAIVEEYLAGPEFSLDALVSKGKCFLCGLADRHIYFEPFFVELGHTMPAKCSVSLKEKLTEAFFTGIKALGIELGAAKGDLKLLPAGPVIGEIAARLSGGFMSGWTYPYSTGVNITEAAIYLALGAEPPSLKPRFKKVSCERAFISIPGKVKEIKGIEEVKKGAKIKDLILRIKIGDKVKFPENNVEKCGNLISQARNHRQAIKAVQQALGKILIRLEPDDERATSFLLQKEWPFSAFSFKNKKIKVCLEEMQAYYGLAESFNPKLIYLKKLPGIFKQKCLDWHGQTPIKAYCFLRRYYKIKMVKNCKDKFVIGKAFWNIFINYSIQGVIYFFDTMAMLNKNLPKFKEFLARLEQ